MNTIIIYGPGCAKCTELLENTKKLCSEMEGEFNIKKVTDPMQFAVAGVFMTPGLSLNGKLLFSGRNPSIAELKEIIEQELAPAQTTTNCCEQKSESCCSCSGSCGEEKSDSKPCACKKIVLWLVLIVLALAAIKTINRNNKEESPESTSAAPVAAQCLTLSYYKLGVECITCQRMEQWIKEATSSNFAEQIASGALQVQSIKPTEGQVDEYKLTTKTLIARKGDTWHNLDQIWALKDDEAAFKAYIVNKTQELLK